MHTTITSQGQVVIPSAVRRRFGICEGTRYAIDPDDSAQRIILTPITSAHLESQRGRFRRRGLLKAPAAGNKRERETRCRADKSRFWRSRPL